MANYTSDLTRQQVDNTIQSALSMWAKVSPLTFSKVTDGPADIEIIFENKKNKGYSFDGRGGELAYAYFPGSNAGKIKVKSAEQPCKCRASQRAARNISTPP